MAVTDRAPALPEIEAARRRLEGVARVTPVYRSDTVSRLVGREVHAKASLNSPAPGMGSKEYALVRCCLDDVTTHRYMRGYSY